MFTFIDVAGYSKSHFYVLATRGEPGEWSGIFEYRSGRWSLLRGFPGEWVVCIDTFPPDVLCAVTDEGKFIRYSEDGWVETDAGTIHGLTHVACVDRVTALVTGSAGYVARIRDSMVERVRLPTRRRIMVAKPRDAQNFIVAGENGLCFEIIDGSPVPRPTNSTGLICGLFECQEGGLIAVGSEGLVLRMDDSGSSRLQSGVSWSLTDVFCADDDVFYCVGGGLLRFDGEMAAVQVGLERDWRYLCALAGFDDGTVLAAGDHETILVSPDWGAFSPALDLDV